MKATPEFLVHASSIPGLKRKSRSEKWVSRGRFLVEAGVYFVLFEGFLRRLAPEINAYLLTFKFLYFPFLYCLLSLYIRSLWRIQFIPSGALWFFGWGLLVSVPGLLLDPITFGMGVAVNTAFVPLVLLGARLYKGGDVFNRLLIRFTVLAGMIGVLAIVQPQFPANHWLNIALDWKTESISMGHGLHRVTATFQFPNVFGSFVGLGSLVCIGAFVTAKERTAQYLGFSCLFLIYVGGLYSGSRMAGMGALVTVLAALAISGRLNKFVVVSAGVAVLILVFVSLGAKPGIGIPGKNDQAVAISELRAVNKTNDIRERIFETYLALSTALEASQAVGTGWGPYTQGVKEYGARFGELQAETLPLEGGYLFLIAQTGIIGVVGFMWMHFSILTSALARGTEQAWLGLGLVTWSLLANFPLGMQEIPVLSIPWWFLLGIFMANAVGRRRASRIRPRPQFYPRLD